MCVNAKRNPAAAPAPHPVRRTPAVGDSFRNREEWLNRAALRLRDYIADKTGGAVLVGFPYISVGVPVRSSKAIGQCWDGARSADGRAHIFIHAALDNAVQVLETLVHELGHEGVGCEHGHRKPFSQFCKAVGLVAPWTATTAGPELKAYLTALAQELGEYPHAALDTTVARKKQTTRLLKYVCPSCDQIARVSNAQWNAECGDCGVRYELAVAVEKEDE